MSLNSASINMKNDDYVSNLFHGIKNVKELTLCDSTLEKTYKCSFEVYDFKVAEVPNSFLSHLKSFEIRGFFGKESEMSVVEFLLKNVSAIEKMFIKPSPEVSKNLKKQNEVMRRLLILPRASASCLIVFS
ncbi:hypothetical protein ACHQM5_008788 [Ranunculus cassubicifolius]